MVWHVFEEKSGEVKLLLLPLFLLGHGNKKYQKTLLDFFA